MGEREQLLLPERWVNLAVLPGTRWKKAGEYSNFCARFPNIGALFPLPIVENGGFIISQDSSSVVALQPDSKNNAAIRIITKDSEVLLFWNIDSPDGSTRNAIIHCL